VAGCVLTEGLTYEDRRGTLIDWNLCFNARGESSNRAFRSGTPAFMAPVLLKDKSIPQRTLAHDMESFFAVIVWMATLDHFNEAAFQAKPLAETMLDKRKTPRDIVNAKENWFKNPEGFKESITDHFEPLYRYDKGFRKCLTKLRKTLYQTRQVDDPDLEDDLDQNDNKVTEGADPMKEGLFRQCMKDIDDYLGETKGCDEMEQIDKWRAAKGTNGRGAREGEEDEGEVVPGQ
jgi:Fungal protein kinase